MTNCCVVEADLAAVAAGNCYLAEVLRLVHCYDMAMVAENLEQRDVAGNCWRIVVVVVDPAA
jgi:hypothetical protein